MCLVQPHIHNIHIHVAIKIVNDTISKCILCLIYICFESPYVLAANQSYTHQFVGHQKTYELFPGSVFIEKQRQFVHLSRIWTNEWPMNDCCVVVFFVLTGSWKLYCLCGINKVFWIWVKVLYILMILHFPTYIYCEVWMTFKMYF